jgi:tetratricopeptide (TPR) repeat protein
MLPLTVSNCKRTLLRIEMPKMYRTKMLVLAAVALLAPLCASPQDVSVPSERFSDPPRPDDVARAKEEKLKLAVATNPQSAAAWTDFGWRLYEDGRYAECEWVMGQARNLSPNDPYVLWLSGLASYAMGHYEDAKQYLWNMWKDNQTYPDTVDMGTTYDVLGRIFFDRGELFEASYFFSKAVDEKPNNWQVHFALGITEWYRQRYGEALKALEQTRSLKPHDPLVLRCYAWAKLAVDERHLFYTKRAVDQHLWPEAPADEHQAFEDLKADINVINGAIKADPSNAQNFELLGRYYAIQGQTQDAVTALQKAVALDPTNASAPYFLAKTLLSTGTAQAKDQAEDLLIKSIAIAPDFWAGYSGQPHFDLLVTLLLEEGKTGEARAILDWAAAQDHEAK